MTDELYRRKIEEMGDWDDKQEMRMRERQQRNPDEHITPQLYKDGTIPPNSVNIDQARFAVRLWSSLKIGGTWTLPSVGVYKRVGEKTLVLTEIHAGEPLSNLGLFEHHDFIVRFANEIGWAVYEEIERAYDKEHQELNIPEDAIGRVTVCSADCGTVIRVEPVDVWKQYHKIEKGSCPHCGKKGLDKSWEGLHVVIDTTSVKLRKEEEE